MGRSWSPPTSTFYYKKIQVYRKVEAVLQLPRLYSPFIFYYWHLPRRSRKCHLPSPLWPFLSPFIHHIFWCISKLLTSVLSSPKHFNVHTITPITYLFICCCSVAKSCPTATPWAVACQAVLHHLPEFAQTHVPWVGDVIQPSHPLSSPSPPALNLSQHQGLFQWVGCSCQVAKVLGLLFFWIKMLHAIKCTDLKWTVMVNFVCQLNWDTGCPD